SNPDGFLALNTIPISYSRPATNCTAFLYCVTGSTSFSIASPDLDLTQAFFKPIPAPPLPPPPSSTPSSPSSAPATWLWPSPRPSSPRISPTSTM
ncbi:unnamed protein product, partial [Prunus brigantina]